MILLSIDYKEKKGVLLIVEGGTPSVLEDIMITKLNSLYIVSGTADNGVHTDVTLPVGQTILVESNADLTDGR